jgi:hypothetical protein
MGNRHDSTSAREYRDALAEGLRASARWRRGRAEEHADDERNLASAEALERAAGEVDSLDLDHEVLTGFVELGTIAGFAPESLHRLGRAAARFGFDRGSGGVPAVYDLDALLSAILRETLDGYGRVEADELTPELIEFAQEWGAALGVDDPPIDDVDLARIDQAAAGSLDTYFITTRLALTDEEKAGPLGTLASAFDYHEPMGPGSDRVGTYFGPMVENGEERYPPPLDEVSARAASIWQHAADNLRAPAAKARLNDLCFEAGWGHRGERGRTACDAYLAAADSIDPYAVGEQDRPVAAFSRLQRLRRALVLARHISAQPRAEAAIQRILSAADESLAQADPEPGVALGLVEIVLEDNSRPEDITRLLDTARQKYAADYWNASATIDLQLRRTDLDDQTREQLRRELIQTRLDQAHAEEGLVRAHHLEAAARLARDLHQPDLLELATTELQRMNIDDLGLTTHAVEVSIPKERMEAYLAQFTDQATWQDALLLLPHVGPPSGLIADNRRGVAEIARIAPIQAILPHTQLGGDGLPRYTPMSDADRDELQLITYEMRKAQISAVFVAKVLRRIWDKWGPLDEAELTEFFAAGSHVGPELAAALSRDLLRVFKQDYEAAAFCITPRVEALVRTIVLQAGLPIYRVQRQRNPGRYPGLGMLLPALSERGLDESWARFLHGFLSNPAGGNVRNELLHGFELEPGEGTCALLVVCVLHLTRGIGLTRWTDGTPGEPPPSGD